MSAAAPRSWAAMAAKPTQQAQQAQAGSSSHTPPAAAATTAAPAASNAPAAQPSAASASSHAAPIPATTKAAHSNGAPAPAASSAPAAAAAPVTSPPAATSAVASSSSASSSTPAVSSASAPAAAPAAGFTSERLVSKKGKHGGGRGPVPDAGAAASAPASGVSGASAAGSNSPPTNGINANAHTASPARKGKKNKGGAQQQQQQQGQQGQQGQQQQQGQQSQPLSGSNSPQQYSQPQLSSQQHVQHAPQQAFPLQSGFQLPYPFAMPIQLGGVPMLPVLGMGAAGAPLLPLSGAFSPQMFPQMAQGFYQPQQQPPQQVMQQQPQGQHGHGKRMHHNHAHGNNHNNNAPQYWQAPAGGNFYQQSFASASAASAAGPYGFSPQQQQQQQQLFQLANLQMTNMGGAPMYASAIGLEKNAIQGHLPALPLPFAAPPFADLLASYQLPPQPVPYFSVDVECVATGPGHNDRAMGHVSVVDQLGEIVLNLYIRPAEGRPVTSYLPALTGLSEADCAAGVSEEEALKLFRAVVPSRSILVGQNILKDVQWLQLQEGTDFESMLDLGGLFAVKHPQFRSMTQFSLSHEAKVLLSLDQQELHHPAVDAWLSVRLYQLYTLLAQHPVEFERARKLLLETPTEAAFNKKNPVYDGVCMGNRKACTCGSPWLG